MADLRELMAELGYEDVRTVLQSGNVVFTGAEGQGAGEAREGAARSLRLRGRRRVAHDGRAARRRRRRPVQGARPTTSRRYFVVFLPSKPKPRHSRRSRARTSRPTSFAASDRELYAWCPEGMQDSKLMKALGKPGLAGPRPCATWARSRSCWSEQPLAAPRRAAPAAAAPSGSSSAARSRWSSCERPAPRVSRACSAGCRPDGRRRVDRRRPEAAARRVDVEPALPRAIASSRCVLSMLLEPWRAASSRARISAARASGESVGWRGGAERGRGTGDGPPGARCRAAARSPRTTRPPAGRGRRAPARARRARCRSSDSVASDASASGTVSARSRSATMCCGVGGHCTDNARLSARLGTTSA